MKTPLLYSLIEQAKKDGATFWLMLRGSEETLAPSPLKKLMQLFENVVLDWVRPSGFTPLSTSPSEVVDFTWGKPSGFPFFSKALTLVCFKVGFHSGPHDCFVTSPGPWESPVSPIKFPGCKFVIHFNERRGRRGSPLLLFSNESLKNAGIKTNH